MSGTLGIFSFSSHRAISICKQETREELCKREAMMPERAKNCDYM